jgi:peptide-methionine (R)-S-oxide reductase
MVRRTALVGIFNATVNNESQKENWCCTDHVATKNEKGNIMRMLLFIIPLLIMASACNAQLDDTRPVQVTGIENQTMENAHNKSGETDMTPVDKSSEEYASRLSEKQKHVLCDGGTEAPFTGKYYAFKGKGRYVCAGCGNELFSSEQKYDSGSGWPSFWAPLEKSNVSTNRDESFGMIREEVVCSKCGGHLGHVFDDGPRPTGLRYCINSVALDFKAEE